MTSVWCWSDIPSWKTEIYVSDFVSTNCVLVFCIVILSSTFRADKATSVVLNCICADEEQIATLKESDVMFFLLFNVGVL
jgi:hypothetical protein